MLANIIKDTADLLNTVMNMLAHICYVPKAQGRNRLLYKFKDKTYWFLCKILKTMPLKFSLQTCAFSVSDFHILWYHMKTHHFSFCKCATKNIPLLWHCFENSKACNTPMHRYTWDLLWYPESSNHKWQDWFPSFSLHLISYLSESVLSRL